MCSSAPLRQCAQAHLSGYAGADAQLALGVDAVLVGDDGRGELAGHDVQLLHACTHAQGADEGSSTVGGGRGC